MSGGQPGEWARPITIGIIGGAVLFALGIRKDAHARIGPAMGLGPAVELHVPHVAAAPTIDGELDEAEWLRAPARTGVFLGVGGTAARPFSDARLLWDHERLYLVLYAADEDIRVAKAAADGPLWTGDAFGLVFVKSDGTKYVIDVGPSGVITDGKSVPAAPAASEKIDYAWQSGAKVATDIDGTLDDPRDRDEEWVVEMSVPLASLGMQGLGGERIGFGVRRCDTVDQKRVCGSFGQPAIRAVLVLD